MQRRTILPPETITLQRGEDTAKESTATVEGTEIILETNCKERKDENTRVIVEHVSSKSGRARYNSFPKSAEEQGEGAITNEIWDQKIFREAQLLEKPLSVEEDIIPMLGT